MNMNGIKSRSQKSYNKDYKNKSLIDIEEFFHEVRKSYLNIWDTIPSLKDINLTFAFIKAGFILGLTILFNLLFYLINNNLAISILINLFIMLLFLFVFRDSLFFFFSTIKKYGRVDPFGNLKFWRIKEDPLSIFISNRQDLRYIGIRMFKIRIMAENIKPNLNHFIKSLNILKIPFSYQIIQTPVLNEYLQRTIKISIYFTISYYIDGFLTNTKFNELIRALEEFSLAFKSNCITDFAHYKINSLSNIELIHALQTFYLGKESNYNKKGNQIEILKFPIIKSIVTISILLYLDGLLFYHNINVLIILIGNLAFFIIILFVFWREALFYLSQLKFIKLNIEFINPFQDYKFYYIKIINDSIFVHMNNQFLFGMKYYNLQEALPPQFYGNDQFISNPDKFYRSLIGQKLPFTYTTIVSPIDFPMFEREGLDKLNQYALNEVLHRKTEVEQEQWLNMRGGIWRTKILFSVNEIIRTNEVKLKDIELLETRLQINSAKLSNSFKSNFPNYK